MGQIYFKGTNFQNVKYSTDNVPLDTLRITWDNDGLEPLSLTPQLLDKDRLKKRARRKMFGDAVVKKLIPIASEKQAKRYRHTLYCADCVNHYQNGKIAVQWYCKRRWCMQCTNMRAAQVMARLKPVVESWGQPYFVTLTQGPTVEGEALKPTIDKMLANIGKCKDRAKKRQQRNGEAKFVGVRKLECTFNERDNRYHPHFHVLVNGAGIAQNLVADWLSLNPGADVKAQNYKPANNDSLVELTKYMTKLTATGGGKNERKIYVDGLHTMFVAMSGIRTIQTFGFKLPAEKEVDGEASDNGEAVSVSRWIPELSDWGNTDTGELLSGYIPSEAMKDVIAGVTVSPHYNVAGNG